MYLHTPRRASLVAIEVHSVHFCFFTESCDSTFNLLHRMSKERNDSNERISISEGFPARLFHFRRLSYSIEVSVRGSFRSEFAWRFFDVFGLLLERSVRQGLHRGTEPHEQQQRKKTENCAGRLTSCDMASSFVGLDGISFANRSNANRGRGD